MNLSLNKPKVRPTPLSMSSRSDPAVIQKCVEFVRNSHLPVLNASQDRLLSAVHGPNSAWRTSAPSVFAGLIQEDIFLALRVARDATRAAAECHCDVPNTLEAMITLSGLGRYHEYTSCPKLEYDWPPTTVGSASDTATIRARMVKQGAAAVSHARLAVKDAAALNYPHADAVGTLTLLLSAADFALALSMPKRIHDSLIRDPKKSFVETVMGVCGVHPDDFCAALSEEMGWPTKLVDDAQGTISAICAGHATGWRSSFPPAAAGAHGSNVVPLW